MKQVKAAGQTRTGPGSKLEAETPERQEQAREEGGWTGWLVSVVGQKTMRKRPERERKERRPYPLTLLRKPEDSWHKVLGF